MSQGQFDRLDYQPRSVHDHLHVRLLAIDEIQLNQTWAAHGVRSPFWRLYINDQPGAMLEVEGRRHPITPGYLHLIPAWVRFNCWNESVLRHFFIHFDPVGWPPAVVRKLFGSLISLPPAPAAEALLAPLLVAIKDDRHDAPETLSLAKALTYQAISRIVPATTAQEPATAARAVLLEGPNPVNPALRYIDSHLSVEIDNAALAAFCHLSRSHFIRTFHATVGQTPAQYIRERRVARAAEELVLTRAKIDDIAIRCGFPNRFYFSRAFTQVMGVPPAKYRVMTI